MCERSEDLAHPATRDEPFHLVSEEQACRHQLRQDLEEILQEGDTRWMRGRDRDER